ncbi:MAG: LexA repressor [uncultured bacterium]|nr:MAG: LexA repressor [uncultured bacterium]
MYPLTKKQREIFNFISNFISDLGYAPSYREIGQHFNLSSVATVAEHINSLREKDYLDIGDGGEARSIEITKSISKIEPFDGGIHIPLLGFIAAGQPIEAIKTNETIDIPRDMMARDVFALKVHGRSMIDDGIFDGDYVIIQKTNSPKNGEIVVALLNGENATLKRYYKEKSFIRLQPANSQFAPIRAKKVLIQGRVKGLIRKYY